MHTEGTAVLDDRYALEEVIGRGGMAEVYRATDRVLARRVAVKLLRHVAAGSADRARFAAEARTLARLDHPNLVTVLDAGTASEQPYLVMELVDGPSLAECCSGTGLDITRVSRIAEHVSDALAYAHITGVVHRDVKPGNVLLGGDGRARLADFGIARLLDDSARHTRTGMTIGSPAYLSPEQVRGQEVTTASDVYSLGLVLLEALTGRPVYSGTPTESALARLSTSPDIPSTLPPGWQDLLRAMTALDPLERPTAAQVAERARALTAGPEPDSGTTVGEDHAGHTRLLPSPGETEDRVPATTGTLKRTARPGQPTPSPRLLHARWAVAGLLVVLLVTLAVVWLVVAVGGDAPEDGAELPQGVSPRLEEPLRDLHDAVHGDRR